MWGVLEVGGIGHVNLADRCSEFQTSSTRSLGLKLKRLGNLSCRCSAQPVSADDGGEQQTLVAVGGGAAGVYGALRAKSLCPNLKVLVLEKGKLLSKVRISGGGRCNVTTGLFQDPEPLAGQYPRGHRELRGTYFRTHGPQDTAAWFMERGVALKTESDGRMFPESNSSATIVECLLNEAHRIGGQMSKLMGSGEKEVSLALRLEDWMPRVL